MMRCEIFTDPLFASDRYVEFEPNWVVAAEDTIKYLFPRKKYPVTSVRLKDGKHYLLAGHLAAQIKAAQSEAAPQEVEPPLRRSQSKSTPRTAHQGI